MSTVMLGTEVARAMKEDLIRKTELLKEQNIEPCLTIIRVGAREDDLSYERGAKKRMEITGITCHVVELPEDISQSEFEEEFRRINEDPKVHGILLFCPLPKTLNEEPIRKMIDPRKDVDGISPLNAAGVFTGDDRGFTPCTAEAVMEMLEHYEIPVEGKKVTVVGRSAVIGKPVSMLLLKKNATVTICHTKTADLAKTCREADILVAAAGHAAMIREDMVGENAVVVDVGIHVDENGNLCGDVAFDEVEQKASHISPVPRGVGSITTSVLAKHVLRAAKDLNDERK